MKRVEESMLKTLLRISGGQGVTPSASDKRALAPVPTSLLNAEPVVEVPTPSAAAPVMSAPKKSAPLEDSDEDAVLVDKPTQ